MQTPLRDVMSWNTLTIRPEMTVADAMALMADREIDHLFVIDDANRFLGIVTDHSLLKAELTGQTTETTVAAWMLRRPETLTTEHTVADAIKLCRDASLSRIPIVREGRLIGVIERREVLRWIVRHRIDQSQSATVSTHHSVRESVTV